MAGFVNNFLESTSTLFSNTWTGLKTNTKNAIQYSYYNYYLKLVASHHFYYDRYKSDIYHAEKTYNTETPAKKGSKHLSLMWVFILPIMPITENPLYISIIIPALAIITYLDSCFLHIKALVWAHNFLSTIGASIPSIFSFSVLTPFTIPAAILTAAAFYRVLKLPKAKNDRSKLTWLDTFLVLSVFALTIFVPASFPIITMMFALYFLTMRIFYVEQNNIRFNNFLRHPGPFSQPVAEINNALDRKVYSEDVTLGFHAEASEIKKVADMTVTRRERQLYSLGILFFLGNLTLMFSSKLSISISFMLAPIFSGITISLLACLAIAAIIMPINAYYSSNHFTPEKIELSLDYIIARPSNYYKQEPINTNSLEELESEISSTNDERSTTNLAPQHLIP